MDAISNGAVGPSMYRARFVSGVVGDDFNGLAFEGVIQQEKREGLDER